MQKHLVRVGNSLALVVDKALLSVLSIDHRSSLRVSCDGQRLIVEPLLADGRPRAPKVREALIVAHELEKLGLSQAVFEQIAPVPMRLGQYIVALETKRDLPAEIVVTAERLDTLRERLREGWTRTEAIAAAIASSPFLLPTGVETRLDDGVAMRPLLDVLLDERDEHTVAASVRDPEPGDSYDADAPHDAEVTIELSPDVD